MTRAAVEEQFTVFEPTIGRLKEQRLAQAVGRWEEKLYALQAGGDPVFCSAHMLERAAVLLQSTAQWSRIQKQIWLLKVSLEDKDQDFAMNQELHDGSWGVCYDEWFRSSTR